MAYGLVHKAGLGHTIECGTANDDLVVLGLQQACGKVLTEDDFSAVRSDFDQRALVITRWMLPIMTTY